MDHKTACTRDCPDACGLVATVEDGRITKLRGDPDHPVTRGFLCYRTSRYLERQYDPDRLTSPLIRRNGSLEESSWDEALDLVAAAMLRIRDESGPEAILHYRCGGSLGILKHVTDHFFERFGPTAVKSGDICSGAGEAAQVRDFGIADSNDLFDLRNSRTIVMWGKNPYVSGVHLVPLLKAAKEAGTTLVQVDPVRHRGADPCDLVLQPRPGGDIAVALGVARLLFERGQVDPQAATYCDGVDGFRALALGRSTGDWADLADVPEDALDALATAYADGPSAILVGWGMQRRSNGATTVRVLDALGAVSGNVGVPGGGVSFYFGRRTAFTTPGADPEAVAPRTVPESRLGPGILAAEDPPIRMVWVTAANPVVMLPESATTAHALESREMTVVVDSFLTDTARLADIVLPTTTMLEEDDLVGAYGHHWLAEVRPVVAPLAGARSDLDIVRALAPRVGLENEFEADAEDWKRRLLSRIAPKGASLEELRNEAVRNPEAPEILFADRRFPTPTGRVDLVREVDAVPATPPADRPLFLMAMSTARAQGSQWPRRSLDDVPEATLHPASASGFKDGDRALLESEIGSMAVVLRFDPRQRRDVVMIPKGGWMRDGACANTLVTARTTDDGGGAVYYETAVRVVPG